MNIRVVFFIGVLATVVAATPPKEPEGVVKCRTFPLNGLVRSCGEPRLSQDPFAAERSHAPDPRLADILSHLDGERWFSDIADHLAVFNRHTHGSGILVARDWIMDEFEAIEGLEVQVESFSVGATTAYNVVARKAPTVTPARWIVVGAHYDAVSGDDGHQTAPGAEDNASGTAGVLAMARALAEVTLEAGVMFVCYSAEEQGLFGSTAHVQSLEDEGLLEAIEAVIIMDMIGYDGDGVLDCLLETYAWSSGRVQDLAQAAADYTDLTIATSYQPFGSDHMPYLQAGIQTVLTIENDWDIYPYYHTSLDLPGELDQDMALAILKMNLAATVTWGGLVDASLTWTEGLGLWSQSILPFAVTDANANGVIDVCDLVNLL
jgi:hypothetical protein